MQKPSLFSKLEMFLLPKTLREILLNPPTLMEKYTEAKPGEGLSVPLGSTNYTRLGMVLHT